MAATPPSSCDETEFLVLSRWGFVFWWVVILLIHLITFVFNACYAKFYWVFGSTVLGSSLETYDVGMGSEYFHSISYVHVVLAAAHGGCLLLMAIGSMCRRSLVFSPWSDSMDSSAKRPRKSLTKTLKGTAAAVNPRSTARISRATLFRGASLTYANIADRRGMLGVNGRYFYAILLCRELIETSFQTVQAFRMSKYLSNTLLNRFYVVLLVINCWSSVLVHTKLFGKDEARRRFTAIVFDCALDLISSIGLSLMIIAHYVDQYDAALTGFGFELLDDDDWMARMLDEARLVLVSSWWDLFSRVVFSLGIIITTASMKELLRWRGKRVQPAQPATGPHTQSLRSVGPLVPGQSIRSPLQPKEEESPGGYRLLIPRHFWCNDARVVGRMRQVLFTCTHCIFLTWGVAVLALHVHASVRAPLVECNPTVYPMAGAQPACFAVEFNCYKVGISGTIDEVVAEWGRFDHSTVVKMHIVHCPALEVPEMFQEFTRLREIWVYNSTVRDWGPEASFTNSCHPNLTVLSLVRTNLTDMLLPLGFQDEDFPAKLSQLYFCDTNLRTLPDDLDKKWNLNSNLYIENSELTAVPLSLVRLQPYFLSLAGNPIQELPSELFETPWIQYLIVSSSNVVELPRNVTQPPTGPAYYDFSHTNIAFFWSWMDLFVENARGVAAPRIIANATPYCSDLDKIFSSVSTDFSTPFQDEYSKLLMNASKTNWDFLRQAVDCTPRAASTQFPLEFWDNLYGML